MVCYYHPERAAQGVCKFCGRGLCDQCATLVEDALACRARHETPVHDLVLMERRGILQAQRMAAGYLRNAIFYGLVGSAFAAFGWLQYRFLGVQAILLMLVGLFLLYAGLANLWEARRYRG